MFGRYESRVNVYFLTSKEFVWDRYATNPVFFRQRGLYEAWLERTREAPAVGLPMRSTMFTAAQYAGTPGPDTARNHDRSHQGVELTHQVLTDNGVAILTSMHTHIPPPPNPS